MRDRGWLMDHADRANDIKSPRLPARLRAACILAALAMAGCMSIPLATMWQLRNFSAEDVAAVDPAALRVATLVEPGNARFDPSRSKLTLTLARKSGTAEPHVFGLRAASVQGGAIVPTADPRWQVLELDAQGRAAMRALQPRLAKIREHYTGATFDVSMKLDEDIPVDVDDVRFSVRLQLAADQAPLVLFDRARIPVDRVD